MHKNKNTEYKNVWAQAVSGLLVKKENILVVKHSYPKSKENWLHFSHDSPSSHSIDTPSKP